MAIVRSQEGHFFEVPDTELSKYAMKQEDIPESAKASPDLTQGTGMGPMGSGGGQGVSPVQIIVNYMGGMGGGMGGGPQGGEGQAQGAEAGAQGQKQDVGGRYCGHWHNCWRNCWRNYWRNFSW